MYNDVKFLFRTVDFVIDRLPYLDKIQFCCYSNKTYVVGIQRNCLNEMVLFSTQIICLN